MSEIRVHVTAFWLARENHPEIASGLQEIEVAVTEGSRIKDLIALLIERFSDIKAHDVMLVLNNVLVQENAVLHDGDRVALFPPLMGG